MNSIARHPSGSRLRCWRGWVFRSSTLLLSGRLLLQLLMGFQSASRTTRAPGCRPKTYLLFCPRLQLEVVHMQTALGLLLLTCPPACTFSCIARAALDSAVPVANAPVPLAEELVARHLVGVDIPLNERECPGAERVQLHETSVVDLEGLQVRAVCALGCTAAGDDCLHTELLVCPASGLNLYGETGKINQEHKGRR